MTDCWRIITPEDYPLIRPILRDAIAGEDALTLPADAPDSDVVDYWFGAQRQSEVWALERNGRILGTYYQRPNHYALGAHIANGAYAVAACAREQGIGRLLGEHSLARARERGYRAMQFNFVVSTNSAAVDLWQSLGFSIIGTISGGYHLKRERFVDAHIMYRQLP